MYDSGRLGRYKRDYLSPFRTPQRLLKTVSKLSSLQSDAQAIICYFVRCWGLCCSSEGGDYHSGRPDSNRGRPGRMRFIKFATTWLRSNRTGEERQRKGQMSRGTGADEPCCAPQPLPLCSVSIPLIALSLLCAAR